VVFGDRKFVTIEEFMPGHQEPREAEERDPPNYGSCT
jgi:hypothetical protein